jgi:hypothetical protein
VRQLEQSRVLQKFVGPRAHGQQPDLRQAGAAIDGLVERDAVRREFLRLRSVNP